MQSLGSPTHRAFALSHVPEDGDRTLHLPFAVAQDLAAEPYQHGPAIRTAPLGEDFADLTAVLVPRSKSGEFSGGATLVGHQEFKVLADGLLLGEAEQRLGGTIPALDPMASVDHQDRFGADLDHLHPLLGEQSCSRRASGRRFGAGHALGVTPRGAFGHAFFGSRLPRTLART